MILLCTDTHLTDADLDSQRGNSYRWGVFGEIARVCQSYDISAVYHLGDMVDTRGPHSAKMVNRLVDCWMSVPVAERFILRGNHDTPLSGPAYWEFLSRLDGIEYVTRPTLRDDLLLLPFSPNPRTEWRGLPMRDCRAIFVHATRSGTIAENGFQLSGQDLPLIPMSVKVYSGDVHNQQVVGNWTYVGASSPIKFGDAYSCRFLLLDEDTYEVVEEVPVTTLGRRVVEVSTLDDLSRADVRPGDQVKIRAAVSPDASDWGALERAVDAWAIERGVEVASIEGRYEVAAHGVESSTDLDPEELLKIFAHEENITHDLLDVGLDLLKEVIR